MNRTGRNKTLRNNLSNRNSSRSRSRSLHPELVMNTETNENFSYNSNENNFNDEPRGKAYYRVEDQLMNAIWETEALPVSEVIHRLKNILEKIATRPGGTGRYPRNKLQTDTINEAILQAVRNPDPRIYHQQPVCVAVLDTLLSHRLFKNATKRTFDNRIIPYDVVNEALILTIRSTDNVHVVKYLMDHGANPAYGLFIPLVAALQKRTEESNAVVEQLMQHPIMQKWESLHQAIEYIKVGAIFRGVKPVMISFLVHYMISLLQDESDIKMTEQVKNNIIITHDQYREYMTPEDVEKINKLYAAVLGSMNKKLPSNVHRLIATYGGKMGATKKKTRKHVRKH